MEIILTVTVIDSLINESASVRVSNTITECFSPMKVCDDPIVSMCTGDICTNYEIKRKLRIREDAADNLAKHISKMIINHMSKNDTFNG